MTGQVAAGRARRSWFSRLPALGKLALLSVGLVLVGSFVRAALPTHPHCAYSCGPDTGPLQPDAHSYPSSAAMAASLGFSFGFPSELSVGQPELGSDVTLQNGGGQFLVWSGRGPQSLSSLVLSHAQKISGVVQDLSAIGGVRGAEIGYVSGQGEFYSGQFQTQNGQDVPVGVVVIAAQPQPSGTWVVILGFTACVDPSGRSTEVCSDPTFQTGGILADGGMFDDVLARWRWAY